MVEPSSSEPPVPAHVALIGLMGAGKSAVGSLVAAQLGRSFVDVDDAIEAHTGMTVRQLYERGGEFAYRPLERDLVVHALAGDGPDVVAVPGGAPEDHLVQLAFEAADVFTVWLRVEVPTLVERVRLSDHRPLLGEDPAGVLSDQAVRRAALYRRLADLELDAGRSSAEDLAVEVVDAARGHRLGPAARPGAAGRS